MLYFSLILPIYFEQVRSGDIISKLALINKSHGKGGRLNLVDFFTCKKEIVA